MINAFSIKGSDVYVAGYQITTINNTLFWKNNVAVTYPVASNEVIRIVGLQVVENDVYTIGAISFDRKSIAIFSKNNTATTVVNSSGATSTSVNDITIVDGVTFICGSESTTSFTKAKIWINDKETILSDGTKPEVALGIFVIKK